MQQTDRVPAQMRAAFRCRVHTTYVPRATVSPANMSSYAGVCIETSTNFQSSLTIAGYQSWMNSSSPSPILGRLSTSETLWDMALERHRGLSRQALRHQADWTLQACTAQQERQVAPPRPCPGSQPPLWLKPRSTQSAWGVHLSRQVSCRPAPAMLQCTVPTCGNCS